MTNTSYLIISPPESDNFTKVKIQLQTDLDNGLHVSQLFFYSDSVSIGTLAYYPDVCEALIDLAENHHIPLHLCSAGFQKRNFRLSSLGGQDFIFKGLGQFIAESRSVDFIHVF
ncbi:MAG: hypothetical protein ACWIPH_04280 [Ostreibacterium sp.]